MELSLRCEPQSEFEHRPDSSRSLSLSIDLTLGASEVKSILGFVRISLFSSISVLHVNIAPTISLLCAIMPRSQQVLSLCS